MILFLSDCMVRAVTQVWLERQVIFSTGQLTDGLPKVIYPKYSKHRLSTVAHTIKSWFKSWVIIFTFQVFWVKKHSKLT